MISSGMIKNSRRPLNCTCRPRRRDTLPKQPNTSPKETALDCSAMNINLNNFRTTKKYCDVTVRVDRRNAFQCHRVVLAAVSEFFDAMFGGNFHEGGTNDVELHDIDAGSFEEIVACAYTGRKPRVTLNNVYNLYRISEFLKIRTVEKHCINFILTNLSLMSTDSLLEIFSLACSINATVLVEPISRYIVKHFVTFYQHRTFLELPFEDLKVLLKEYRQASSVLSSFPFRDDNILLDVLIRWVDHSRSERKVYLERLLCSVDFERIGNEYVEFLSESRKISHATLERWNDNKLSLQKVLVDKYSDEHDPTDVMDVDDEAPRPYQGSQVPENEVTMHVYLKNPREDQLSVRVLSINKFNPDWYESCLCRKITDVMWEMCTPFTLDDHKCVYALKGDPYVTQTFHAYDSIDISSSGCDLTPPPACMPYFQVCSPQNSCIYFYRYDKPLHLGSDFVDRNAEYCKIAHSVAFSDEEIQRGIFNYNVEVDKWFAVPEPKTKLYRSCMIVDDRNLVYLVGGDNYDPDKDSVAGYVQAYDCRAPRWFEPSRSRHVYSLAGGCFVNGKVYVSNGQVLEAYDPTADRWESVAYKYVGPNKRPEWNFRKQMLYYANRLWLFGDDKCFNPIVAIFDMVSRELDVSTSLNEAIADDHHTYRIVESVVLSSLPVSPVR